MISIRGVAKRFGRTRALEDIDLEIAVGETVVLSGPNGSGKSTLLRVVAGLLAPSAGIVEIAGRTPRTARASIGYLGHEPHLYPQLTIAENLEFFRRLYDADPGRMAQLVTDLGLDRKAGFRVQACSRGEVQRAALARALLHSPEVLLLDEPLNGLDEPSAQKVTPMLLERARVLVVATHDVEAQPLPHRVVRLSTGRIREIVTRNA